MFWLWAPDFVGQPGTLNVDAGIPTASCGFHSPEPPSGVRRLPLPQSYGSEPLCRRRSVARDDDDRFALRRGKGQQWSRERLRGVPVAMEPDGGVRPGIVQRAGTAGL